MTSPSQTATAHLIGGLRTQGIHYLLATTDVAPATLSPDALLWGLAQSDEPRLRAAMVALLLRQPSFAQHVPIDVTPPTSPEWQMQTHLLAALYLQRQWYWLLSLAFGHAPTLPEPQFALLWHARKLPAPDRHFGEAGLLKLAAGVAQQTHQPLDYAGDWQNSVAHLITQEWSRVTERATPTPYLIAPTWHYPDEMEVSMSLRPDVTYADIERFLQELGQMVQHPGRVYLVGGAALVHAALRGQGASTADIDLKLDVSDLTEVETAIRQLKVRLGVNVELASPADFIPLPTSWEAASQYVGRYGALDVFYFDYVTLALAKIERGQSRDLRDVELLAQAGLLHRDQLEAAFQQILPQVGTGRFFNIDPAVFARKVAAAIQTVWGPTP